MNADDLDTLLGYAPELSLAPSMLVGVNSVPGDPKTNARVAARSIGAASTSKAKSDTAKNHGSGILNSALNFFHHGVSAIGNASSFLASHSYAAQVTKQGAYKPKPGAIPLVAAAQTAPTPSQFITHAVGGIDTATAVATGKALGAGVNEVHHQYRALRDIAQTHGVGAALLEGTLIAGAGAAGSLAGPGGAALSAEATAGATERTLFPDSWERTKSGEGYRDGAGQKVGPGYDAARLLGLKSGSLPYSALSGIVDGLFVLGTDPVQAALATAKGFNATEEAATGLIGKLRGDTRIANGGSADFDSILVKRPGLTRVLSDVAKKQAAEIARDYPKFAPLAADLGEAQTADEAAQVFRDAIDMGALRGQTMPILVKNGTKISNVVLAGSAMEPDPVLGRLQRFGRRLTTKQPMVLNPDTLDYTHIEIDPEVVSQGNVTALRNAMKMSGLSNRVIDGTMQDYILGGVGERKLIAKNIFMRGFLADAFRVDPGGDINEINDFAAELNHNIVQQIGGTGGMDGGEYGFDVTGHSTSVLRQEDGGTATAALYQGQRGKIPLPDYSVWVRASREEAGGATALYGKVDDFAYAHILAPFKKLALATGGFALRVGGLAEGVPAAFREGLIDLVRATATGRAARSATRIASTWELEEDESLAQAAMDMLHNGNHVVMNEKLAKDAVDLAVANHGDIVPPALRAGNFETDTRLSAVARDKLNFYNTIKDAPATHETGRFAGTRGNDELFPEHWGRALREASNDAGTRIHAQVYADQIRAGADVRVATREAIRADEAWLRDPKQAPFLDDMMRSKVPAQAGEDPIRSFARMRVESTKGLTHYLDPQNVPVPHLDLLDAVAGGDIPSYEALSNRPSIEWPQQVKGRIREADLRGNWIDKLADFGYKKMIDPIINGLGRNHQYLLEYSRTRAAFDSAVEAGLFTEEEATQKAQEIAVKNVSRFIHNPYDRSQFSTLARNFIPFYFAQEQAYARMGRLLATDPQAFRRYQLANLAMTDFLHRQEDADGRSHTVIPGLGFLDEAGINVLATILPDKISQAAPTAILGNVNSLDSVLPFSDGPRPNFSVFVTLASKGIEALLPEAAKPAGYEAESAVLGDIAANSSVFDQIMPNSFLRNAVHAFGGPQVDSAAIATAQALAFRQTTAMQKWIASGHQQHSGAPDDPIEPGEPNLIPTDWQKQNDPSAVKKLQERVRNQSRISLAFKAIISEFSPLAPSVDIGDFGVTQGMAASIKKYGLIDGQARYLEKHPDATPYTVFATESKGVPVQPYELSQNFVNDHAALFKKYPAAAGYLVPQITDGKYDSTVWQEQLALGMRSRKGFEKFVDDMYVSEGFSQYDQDLKVHQAELARVGQNSDAATEENTKWSTYLSGTLAKTNPVWWNYFTAPDRDHRRTNELDQLRLLVADKTTPTSGQLSGIRDLLTSADIHLATLNNGSLDGWSKEERRASVDNWEAYLDGVQTEHPELALVISRLFKYVGNK